MKKIFSPKNLSTALGFLGLYLISAGISWAFFSFAIGGGGSGPVIATNQLQSKRSRLASLPRTEVCPINGAKFTEIEREIWENRRPLTAVIENHVDARPLEGLSRADIVYEAVAEAGVTRNLAVFYCGVASEDVRIAPVRSARVHFIKWAAGYGEDPIFLHIGGANNFCSECPGGVKPKADIDPRVNAYSLLSELRWTGGLSGNDLDAERNLGFPAIRRDPERLSDIIGEKKLASEHTVVGMTDKIFEEANKRGFGYENDGEPWTAGFTPWKFVDGAPATSPDATDISFGFWRNNPDYDVRWQYDPAGNQYRRFNGGSEVLDLSNENSPVMASNVAVIFARETGPVDNEKHILYDVVGEGKAIVFKNGTSIKGTWEKEDIASSIKFADEKGREVEFVRGPVWVEALPLGNEVNF